MPLVQFRRDLWTEEDPAYAKSILAPIAPEYTTGEVLLGASYRKLLLGRTDAEVDLEQIPTMTAQLAPPTVWPVILWPGALSSPVRGGQARTHELPQLMPLVPRIAAYACVLGKRRSRWDPGTLLLSAIGSGTAGDDAVFTKKVSQLSASLSVDASDDLLARFIEQHLAKLVGDLPTPDLSGHPRAPAWRSVDTSQSARPATPAERLSEDVLSILDLKQRLTRRQWTVLLESLLRLGLGTHVLWLCRLNQAVWACALRAVETGEIPEPLELERSCWDGHQDRDPLLELGQDAMPFIKRLVQDYARARIGLNLVLHSLTDGGAPWGDGGLGLVGRTGDSPAKALRSFLAHVAKHRDQVSTALEKELGARSLRDAAGAVCDSRPRVLAADSGPTKNLSEFLRHTLGELRPRDPEMSSYDQAYVLYKKNKAQTNSPWPVQPGPAALIQMVYSCCRNYSPFPASIDDFRTHLSAYGIYAPAGELQRGRTGRDLERLGLVVDSPDAGGGRLLVNPF